MKPIKVAILGANGMLGSMLVRVFALDAQYQLLATVRESGQVKTWQKKYPEVIWRKLDVQGSSDGIVKVLKGFSWIINAIGIIKPHIQDDDAEKVERAIVINAVFPFSLARAAEKIGAKVIQIATDCVYSGERGKYQESDPHDPLDVYGKTKSLGEAYGSQMFHLRTSIIGPEIENHKSLLDWFLGQPKNAWVNGFTNHRWNGVTTLHFAKICQGMIQENLQINHLQHLVPASIITKGKLLQVFTKEFDRKDLKIKMTKAKESINRSLSTNNPELNKKIWQAAGYQKIPKIEDMVKELAQYLKKQ